MQIYAFDLEIEKAILGRGEDRYDDIEYCDGFEDHKNMGISVLTAVSEKFRPFVFCGKPTQSAKEWGNLSSQADRLVSFNGVKFDNNVISHTWGEQYAVPASKHFDILRYLWLLDGLDPDDFHWKTHGGYSLAKCCEQNGMPPKMDSGGNAPISWQRGNHGHVITYCLDDSIKTMALYRYLVAGKMRHPRSGEIVDNSRIEEYMAIS